MTGPRVRHTVAYPGSFPAPPTDRRADDARRQIRRDGFLPLAPDERIAPILEPGEAVLAVSSNATLTRTCDETGGGAVGEMYLTTRRLIHLTTRCEEIELDDIREAVATGEWLLLDLGRGTGVRIAVDQPDVLRVRTAAARSARRQQRRAGPKPGPMER